jgi:hypothetical protein
MNVALDNIISKLRRVSDVFYGRNKLISVRFVVLYDPAEVSSLQQSGVISSLADLDALTIKNCEYIIDQAKAALGDYIKVFQFYTETRIDVNSGNGSNLFVFVDYLLAL